jgi:DNA-binding transcriptional regulator YhcF (GntR family)
VLITVDPASPVPLADQVAASVRRAMIERRVGPGDRLPPARDVAESLGINMHTVLRGYQQLRDQGLLELRRGRGAVLTGGATHGRADLTERVDELAALARSVGVAEQEVLAMVRLAFR